jgi:tetratricopeptide (TPR) repeat protein
MNSLKSLFSRINLALIYIVALFLPLVFTPLTTEYYETTKLILVGSAALIMFLTWGLRLITENRLNLVKTPLDLLMILYLIIAIVSTILSSTPFTSLFGILPRIQGSLLSQVGLVLLYFMLVANIKTAKQTLTVIQLLTFSGLIMAVVSLMSYFKWFLPFKAAAFTNFSLVGSPSSTGILLAILLPLGLTALFNASHSKAALKNAVTLFYFISVLIFVITIVLIGNMAAWVGALFATGITTYFHLTNDERKLNLKSSLGLFLGFLGFTTLVVAILSYTPTLKNATIFGKLASEFNREIQMPFSSSWKISASAFRDSPILGTGPATYLYNFTQYKPVEFNKTNFWNVRLANANNQYLQTWAELGGAGILILLLIATTFSFYALKNRDNWGLGIAGVTFLIILAFFPASFVIQAVGFMIFALFMVASVGRSKVHEMVVDFSGRTLSGTTGTHFLLPSLLFLPILILTLAGFYFLGKLSLGEFYNRQALNSLAVNDGRSAYDNLVKAERVNSQVDSYRVSLAQTNFALANAIAAQKGPSEASPAGSLTDQDRKNIQQLLQQAIAEGRAAVTLSPRSAGNWEILATIYRQISGVAENAVAFSLDSYGKAIQLDPLNPLLRLAVGGVYYQAKNYDLAIRFFDDAVSLKPDYANALYNLAVALREKGNTNEGITVAERLVATLQDKPESEDYKLASQLLAELKEKAPAKQAQSTTASPSAALEQKNLPKVLDLPKPENVATPAAVDR